MYTTALRQMTVISPQHSQLVLLAQRRPEDGSSEMWPSAVDQDLWMRRLQEMRWMESWRASMR